MGGLRGALALILAQTVLTEHHASDVSDPTLKVGGGLTAAWAEGGVASHGCMHGHACTCMHCFLLAACVASPHAWPHGSMPGVPGLTAPCRPPLHPCHAQHVRAQAALYTAGIVLVSLVAFAPMLLPLMQVLGLNKSTPAKRHMHK